MGLNVKEETSQRQGVLMSNHCLMSHRLNDVEKITVSGSSNLKTQQKVLKRQKKNLLHFVFLN